MCREGFLLIVTQELFVTYAPGMWKVDLVCTLITISRVWVDSSRSRIHAPYPSGTSETAWGFLAVRLVFELSSSVWATMWSDLCGHRVGLRVRTVSTAPRPTPWTLAHFPDRLNQGSRAALILCFKWALRRMSPWFYLFLRWGFEGWCSLCAQHVA